MEVEIPGAQAIVGAKISPAPTQEPAGATKGRDSAGNDQRQKEIVFDLVFVFSYFRIREDEITLISVPQS